MLVLCAATTARAELLGGVHSGTYAETTYTEINDIEVKQWRMFSDNTYDIVIPNTERGQMILCALVNDQGEIAAQRFGNSLSGETAFSFRSQLPNAASRCFYAVTERQTRPSGSP